MDSFLENWAAGFAEGADFVSEHLLQVVMAAGGDVTVPPEFQDGLHEYAVRIDDAPNGGVRYQIVRADEVDES